MTIYDFLLILSGFLIGDFIYLIFKDIILSYKLKNTLCQICGKKFKDVPAHIQIKTNNKTENYCFDCYKKKLDK
jgi:hypothetical protein